LIVDGKRRWQNSSGRGIDRQDGRNVADVGSLGARRKARPQRVPVVDDVGRINLGAVEQTFPRHVGGHVVEHQVAEDVGDEVDFSVPRIDGELSVTVRAFLLQCRDVDDVSVVFVLIER
jgi:hypothetical protein